MKSDVLEERTFSIFWSDRELRDEVCNKQTANEAI
jgi:hypothetical protein